MKRILGIGVCVFTLGLSAQAAEQEAKNLICKGAVINSPIRELNGLYQFDFPVALTDSVISGASNGKAEVSPLEKKNFGLPLVCEISRPGPVSCRAEHIVLTVYRSVAKGKPQARMTIVGWEKPAEGAEGVWDRPDVSANCWLE